jgi:hypothetical protein
MKIGSQIGAIGSVKTLNAEKNWVSESYIYSAGLYMGSDQYFGIDGGPNIIKVKDKMELLMK